MKKTLLLFIIVFTAAHVFGQPLSLHIGGGFANYNGDLQDKAFTLQQAHGVISAGGAYDVSNHFSVRSDYSFTKLGAADSKSSDASRVQRNLSFQTYIQELSLVAEYNLFDLTQKVWTPYIFAGIGVYKFSPYATDSLNHRVYLQGLNTEGQGLPEYANRQPYKKTQLNIPIGGGVKYALSDDVQLSVEMSVRKLFTDYLDDVSSTYVDRDLLLAARGAQSVAFAYRGDELKNNPSPYPPAGTPRGSEKYKDLYYFGQVKISFRMHWFDNDGSNGRGGKGLSCPKVL